ncbi:FRG domain-containing protein [Fusobacterium polymorphum]|jgi:FRG domain protein|nr:FRG domain-containing protein [Fusobacterium polymorphum]
MREYSVTYDNLTKKMKKVYKGKSNSTRDVTSFVRSNSIKIPTFHDLIMEIAELSYKNPDVMLFYRGQNSNYIKKKYSTLYPTIYRPNNEKDIKFEFEILENSSNELLQELEKNDNVDGEELKDIKKIKLLQYSILQHYEVCKTPLLDVTQSLKVACSFAILDNKNNTGYIYVLGLPYITGRISVDSEDYITNVRLLSISCSSSKRPFFQEGYLVQTEFVSDTNIEKGELDFNRRIVAIYEFKNNKKFWSSENPISKDDLYPPEDTMKNICERIKSKKYYSLDEISNNVLIDKNLVGEFLTLWNKLEEKVRYKTDINNFGRGIGLLIDSKDELYEVNIREINRLRKFRNKVVHVTNKVSNKNLKVEINSLKQLLKKLNMEK